MESEATAAPEQLLSEALLALSWPLPRTVADADAALTRLEKVRNKLTRLEQDATGSDAWWAGEVEALTTQSGFVLEWWRPVLRDPDLDWTLNHQAHLTADLATLASAGARLLDQIEPAPAPPGAAGKPGPSSTPPRAAAGPAAGLVPGFAAAEPPAAAPLPKLPRRKSLRRAEQQISPPPAAPQPPAPRIPAPAAPLVPPYAAPASLPAPAVEPASDADEAPRPSKLSNSLEFPAYPGRRDVAAESDPLGAPIIASVPKPSAEPEDGDSADAVTEEVPATPPRGAPQPATLRSAQPPVAPQPVAPQPAAPPARAAKSSPPVLGSGSHARHRRPTYEFGPGQEAPKPLALPAPAPPKAPSPPPTPTPPPAPPVATTPSAAPAPPVAPIQSAAPAPRPAPTPTPTPARSSVPSVPAPIAPAATPTPAPGARLARPAPSPPPAAYQSAYDYDPYGDAADDETDADAAASAGLRRHQRRLLLQTGAVVAAIGVLSLWAVYSLSSSPKQNAGGAAGSHTTAGAGLGAGATATPGATASGTAAAGGTTLPPSAGAPGPDGAKANAMQVSLVGGRGTGDHILVIMTVDTSGPGQVVVTGSYYGAAGARHVAPQSVEWALAGHTEYQFNVPVTNTDYCGTTFTFTLSGGGRSQTRTTTPGC